MRSIKSGMFDLTESDILHKLGNAKYELNDVALALDGVKEKEFYSEINQIIDSIESFTERYVRRPIRQSRRPIKSSIDYDDIDLYAAVSEAIPMASPSTQDAVEDWLLMTIDPEEEGFESAEDVTSFVENWIEQFADDADYGADEDSIRDLVNCGYLDDSWLDDFESIE